MNNILYGNRIRSSFDMICSYTSAVQGLRKLPASDHFWKADEKQSPLRELRQISTSRSLVALKPKQLPKGGCMYFIERGSKFGTWNFVIVQTKSLIWC